MISKFLNAKHWQLFVLMFGIPIIFQFIMMGTLFSSFDFDSESAPDPTKMFSMMKFFPILMVLYMGLYFGWFWSIAIGLQKKIPEHVLMKTKRFKVFFFIPLIYITLLSFLIGSIFWGLAQNGIPNEEMTNGMTSGMINGWIGVLIGIFIPLHFLTMFGILHSMYFTAKTIKTVELQKEVKFEDFAGEFFMLWFYPIGIWIIQPKINKMVKDSTIEQNV